MVPWSKTTAAETEVVEKVGKENCTNGEIPKGKVKNFVSKELKTIFNSKICYL